MKPSTKSTPPAKPSTMRVRDTVVIAMRSARIDGEVGARIVEAVTSWIPEGVRVVVFDLGHAATLDLEGARHLAVASAKLGGQKRLRLVGLGTRARTQLSLLDLDGQIGVHGYWADAVDVSDVRANAGAQRAA